MFKSKKHVTILVAPYPLCHTDSSCIFAYNYSIYCRYISCIDPKIQYVSLPLADPVHTGNLIEIF